MFEQMRITAQKIVPGDHLLYRDQLVPVIEVRENRRDHDQLKVELEGRKAPITLRKRARVEVARQQDSERLAHPTVRGRDEVQAEAGRTASPTVGVEAAAVGTEEAGATYNYDAEARRVVEELRALAHDLESTVTATDRRDPVDEARWIELQVMWTLANLNIDRLLVGALQRSTNGSRRVA